jgi:serine/threonine protein kinase
VALDAREPRIKGPTAFGPFVLERRLAVGGTAEVFLAHPKIGIAPAPHLVVKRLLPTTGEGSSHYELLEREADLHRKVRHPNVVTVFGAGIVKGEPYLAMEYVEGLDLYRMLRRLDADDRELPIEVALFIARQVTAALTAVHAATDDSGRLLQLVHRDVTPSNVYLSVKGEVKLGDFGIARIEEEARSTLGGGLNGKFGYLAPEQVAGEAFDHRADLFALAALLGELLIGERVFPGGGQLAVLLAIRDGNIEPLRRESARLPSGLFEVCERGLACDPEQRFQSATEFGAALEPFQKEPLDKIVADLAHWVHWAQDQRELAKKLEHKIRTSSQNLQAVRASSSVPRLMVTQPVGRRPPAQEPPPHAPELPAEEVPPRVRRESGELVEGLTFARLIELIATGELTADDEVSLLGREFRRIGAVEELARHVLPSTTAVTGRVAGPGAPDYQFVLHDQSMLEALALLRSRRESGALFVVRGGNGRGTRKEMYLDNGKLHHVASSERNELLGEYLVRRGSLTREDLDRALAELGHHGGRLGDTLISLGIVDAVDVFRAIRDQGRDRVAALCAWKEGLASFYRGATPPHVEFPLDLDLASPIMAGVIIAHEGEPRRALPESTIQIVRGERFDATQDPKEIGRSPHSLARIPKLVNEGPDVARLLDVLTTPVEGSSVSAREAAAAVATAKFLGWIDFVTEDRPTLI